MIKKRIFAYVIDLFIVAILTSLIFSLHIFDQDREIYFNATNTYYDTYQEYASENSTIDELIEAEYNMYHSSSTILITKVGITILYFSIIPYFKNYKTLGKKICKIKIVPTKGTEIKPGHFFLRGLITSSVIFDIITILLLIKASPTTWQTTSIIVNYISYILSLVLLETSIMNKEKRGLHDHLFNTKVIEDK